MAITYLISVKREMRELVPQDWREQIKATPGVEFVSDNNIALRIITNTLIARQIEYKWRKYLVVEFLTLHDHSEEE